ncbi:MAG: tetratricopeptide repeat protein, partial [Planctomycetota bacterium]
MTPPPDNADLLAELIRSPSEERVALVERAGAPDEVLGSLSEAAERAIIADVADALSATEAVADVAEAVGGPRSRARTRRARAKALSYAGRFDEALALCTEALALADDAGDPIEAAHARLVSMHALGEQGRFDEAVAAGESARRAFAEAGATPLAGRADANLGTLHQRRDRPAEALAYFDRARAALTEEPMAVGQIDSNRGETLLVLNDFARAEAAFEAALATFEANDVGWAAAIVDGNLADLAVRRGRLDEAMLRFERARRRLEADASHGHLARLLTEQAEALAILGLPGDAIAAYETALRDLDASGMPLEMARARAGLGLALLRTGRLDEADDALAAAMDAYGTLRHRIAPARVRVHRGALL